MKLLWILLVPALAFGQLSKRAAPSLAPSDSVGMLTRPDTSWVATHDWVDSQGFATGDTTGMLTRTDTTWLLHDYLNDYATVEHDHSGVYLVPSDTNTVMKRPDTSWVATQFWVNDQGFGTGSGDIEGVTAGVGLSGGGISGTVTVNRDTTLAWDVTRTTLNTLLAGKQDAGTYLVPSDTNTVLKRADTSWVMTHDYIGDFATAEHNHTGVYLAVGDSAGRMMRADTSWILHEYLDDYSAVEHDHSGTYQPAGTYLVPSDSTTLKNALLKNADSTSIRNYSGALYLKNADSTTLKNALLKNADSTSIRNYSGALYEGKVTGTGQADYVPKWSTAAGGPVWRPDSTGGSGASDGQNADSIQGKPVNASRPDSNSTLVYDVAAGEYQHIETAEMDSAGFATADSTTQMLVPHQGVVYISNRSAGGISAATAAGMIADSVAARANDYTTVEHGLQLSDSVDQAISTLRTVAQVAAQIADTASARANDYTTVEHGLRLSDSVDTALSTAILKSTILMQGGVGTDSVLINTDYRIPLGYSTGVVIDTIVYIGMAGTGRQVKFQLSYGTDYSGAGTLIDTTTVTSNTTVTKQAGANIDQATVPAGVTVWLTFPTVTSAFKTVMAIVLGHKQ